MGAEAGKPEEYRQEQARDQPAQPLVGLPGQDRGFPDQHAGDEGAEHGVHADQMRDHRHPAHQQQDHGDHRRRRDQIVVGPADQPEHQPPADREADREEGEGAELRLRDREDVEAVARGKAEDDSDDDPAEGVPQRITMASPISNSGAARPACRMRSTPGFRKRSPGSDFGTEAPAVRFAQDAFILVMRMSP
ncbi:hypothetical protein J2R96_007766 [Bradyrhizobium elkanii]|nr:hypothetical protein [Bradyrhizobium elkanii]